MKLKNALLYPIYQPWKSPELNFRGFTPEIQISEIQGFTPEIQEIMRTILKFMIKISIGIGIFTYFERNCC